ncbi:MAG TPA: DUF4365 domain-containing protein [Thermoanaerobaculia bacterium]|nr:DUF4365 domain-containing protein [Thermoanaerobaculia bacterium]
MSIAAHHTGRAGSGIVKTRVEKIQYIFRDMPQESDYGIDAEIEIRDHVTGAVTGRFLKVQIKSGGSYIEKETDDAFVYRNDNLWHLEYWRKCALPVLIIWVDVDAEIPYWAAVDGSAIVIGKSWTIRIPKAHRIDASAKAPLRKLASELADEVAVRVRSDYDRIRDLWAEGRGCAAFSELRALVTQPSWRFAETRTVADTHRSLALWSFLLERDAVTMEVHLRKAKEAEPASDESVVRAMVARVTRGTDAALKLLEHPTNTGAVNLRASLLFHAERLDDAATALSEWPTVSIPNAETERIRARLALARGDMDEARNRLDMARTQKPRWIGVRELSAIIDYFAALPSSEWSMSTHSVPIPVSMQTVRQDDDSLQRLRAAAAAFRELAADAERQDERCRLRTWYLAALANDPAARNDAQHVATEWLAESTLFAPMLPWVIERNLISDRAAFIARVVSEASSIQESDLAETDPNIVVTAIRLLLLEEKKPAEARTLLAKLEHFLRTHDEDAPPYWRVRILIGEGDLDGAAEALELIEKPSPRAEAEMILQTARAARVQDWRAVANDRYQDFVKDRDVPALADAARLHLRHGEPDFVLRVADDLFGGLPNLATLQLICEAAWETGRYSDCLAWIDRWRSLSSTNTEALQQTRLACLLQIDPFQALSAADDLIRSHPSPANVTHALVAFLRVGDLKSLSVTARRLLTMQGTDASTLLSAAHMTVVNDPDLARELWRGAMALGVDDDHVGTALSLAHELGEDRSTASLIARMQQLAAEGRGGVRAVSLPELLEFGAERQQQLSEIFTQYYAAEIPIHAVAQRFGWSLAEIFHVWPAENRTEDATSSHRPLLVRFGGRPSELTGLNGRTLRMDITAFLLAAELGLLDVLERVYAPIRVSRFLATAIVEQQRRLGEGQPSRIAMYERIVALADSGRIRALTSADHAPERATTGDRELDLFLGSTLAETGVFVHQLPFTDFEMRPLVLNADVASRVRDLSAMLAVARRQAVIDASAFEDAAIGLRDPDDNIATLPPTIVLSSLAAHALAAGEGLAQLSASAEVWVSQHVIDDGRASVEWARRRRDVRARIDRLREQLHRGFERGTYIAVGEADVQVDDPRQVEFESLRDLIAGATDADALWIEDRACSAIALGVVGISEVLHDLVGRGELTEIQMSTVLHKLRTADARYLPLLRDDLVHHLRTARARTTPDTKELQAISRLYAAYALDSHRINTREGAPPEIAVLLEASRVTMNTLPEVWRLHREDHPKARRHSWWYMTYLYMGQLAVRACTQRETDAATATSDLAFDLAQLYLGAITVAAGDDKGEASTAAAYIDWLTKAFPYRQFIMDPTLAALTGKQLAGVANSYREVVAGQAEAVEVVDALLSAVFLLLPDELQHAWLKADAAFGNRHGLNLTDRIVLDDLAIPAKSFWAAVERWGADKPAPRRAEVRVGTATNDNEAIETEYRKKKRTIKDSLFVRFAKGGAAQCAAWAERHATFIDMPRQKRRDEGRRIGALKSARERVLTADTLRDGSGQTFYARLRAQLDARETLPETAFQLSAGALADHLRWRGNAEEAAMQLLADVGTEEALRRIVTLPVYLPTAFVKAVADDADVVAIMTRVASTVVSPFSVMQTAALMLRLAVRFPELRDNGAALVQKALAPEFAKGVFKTFERICVVVHGWQSFDANGASLSPHDRLMLAISHAGRLLDVMGTGHVQKARKFFTRVTSVPREFLTRDSDYLSDILYPANLSFEFTVLVGTCSLLRDVPSDVITAAGIGTGVQDTLQRLIDANTVAAFFVDRGLMRGRDGTIYEAEVPDILRPIVGTLPIDLPTSEELRSTAAELLDEACKNTASSTWLRAGAIVRHHPLPAELRSHIHRIAKSLADSATRASINDRDVVLALAFLGGQTAALQDPALREEVQRIAIGVAEEFGTGKRDARRLRETRPAFFEIAVGLSARHGDALGSARELANFVDDLVRSWPSLAYSLAAWLGDYVWTAPPDEAMSLWRMLLRARENAFQARAA